MPIGNRSIHGNVDILQTFAPAVYVNGSGGGSIVDLEGSQGWDFEIGVGTWTDGSHVLTLEHRDDPADAWVTIPVVDLDGFQRDGTDVLTGSTVVIGDATKDGLIFLVAYIGGQNFLRISRNTTGASTGATFYANVVKSALRFTGKNPMSSTWDGAN